MDFLEIIKHMKKKRMDHHNHNHMAMTTVKQEEMTAHIHAQETSGDMNHMMMMTVFNGNLFF